jgi:hypothetical protein
MKTRLYLFSLIALVCACQPEPDNAKLLDELVVSTNYDTEANFSEFTTYALPTDTLGFISDTNPNDTIIVQGSDSNFPRPVLQRIASNLNNNGFTRVDRSDNPDVGINVYVVTDLNLFQQVIYPNYYYPSYYGYGYGYGGYYSYPIVSTYAQNTGALVIEMVDLKHVTLDNKVKVIWTAYLGDLYATIDLIPQAEKDIDQAFLQSPYLLK